MANAVIPHEQPLKGTNYQTPAHVVDPNQQFRRVSGFKINVKNGMAYKMAPKKVIIN